MNPLDALLGPLATVECQRAVRPRWMPWVRLLVGLLAAGIVLVVAWLWMLLSQIDTAFLPGGLLVGGLVALESVLVVLALLLSPALLAGIIAGEKDHGTLDLLLTSRLTSSEIILGRLVGCLSQVAFFLAAGLPPLVLLAAWCDAGAFGMLVLVGLPAAVALGSGGLTVAVSTLARRGRDALLTVYIFEIVLVVAAQFAGNWSDWLDWLAALNPFAALYVLATQGIAQPAALAVFLWLTLGGAGTAVAIWQLWPANRRQTRGESRRRTRRRAAPPVGHRPMLWKELYLETSSKVGVFGRWLTWLLAALLGGGGVAVLAMLVWTLTSGESTLVPWSEIIADAISASDMFVLWLAQWLMGLHAVGAIATERQRATWDGILGSPLEAEEILIAKACGSVYALRWLLAAIGLAWTAAALAGSLPVSSYLSNLALLTVGGSFMVATGVAVGVAMRAGNTARSMASTIGLWIAAAITSAVLAWLLSSVVMLAGMAIWATFLLATSSNTMFTTGPFLAGWVWSALYISLRVSLYLAATTVITVWLVARFDRLAGRMGTWGVGQQVLRSVKTLMEPVPETAAPKT